MSSEAGKPTGHKQLDRELRDMVTSITNRVTDLHKSSSAQAHGHEDEDEHGVRIITLAGNNSGATLRSELDDHQDNPRKRGGHHGLHQGGPNGDSEGLTTYVNSNFQAVNNSIMMGGSYTTNDPGVHLDITDFFEPQGHGKPEKKGKGKKKESFHSDQHQEHDDHE